VTSKKPAVTESGDLPAPTALAAPRVPTEILPDNTTSEIGTSASSKTEVSIGSPEPEAKPEAKPDAQPADTKTEKSGKIRVTGEE
jgi:hypothetical protein